MKQEPIIGQVIEGEWGRDAIHVAVAPVIATERLAPGQRIGLAYEGDCERVCSAGNQAIGIVDPFLEGPVFAGERFWMFLFPRTITSLRHEWTHPAFPETSAPATFRATREESEAWLRSFIDGADCPDYETVIAAATGQPLPRRGDWDDDVSARLWGEYLHFDGIDAHGEIPPIFWDHVSNIVGIPIPANKRAEYFSCSC